MKRLIYIFCFSIVPLLGYSQIHQTMPNFYRPIDSSAIAAANQQDDNVDFSLTVGTAFGSFSGHSMMNSYLAPSVDYQVSSNFSLNFSGIISSYNPLSSGGAMGLSPSEGGMMPLSTNNNSFGISAGGVYHPNDRMYISAQGQYAENPVAPFSLYQNNYPGYSSDYKALSVGVGYQITEKASIDFQFRFSDGYNSYFNPYSSYNGYNMLNRRGFWW